MIDQSWRVDVDSASCIGSGMCVAMAATYFRLVDGRSRPLREDIVEDDHVLDAADACPVEAIRIIDRRTGEVLGPAD